MTKVLSALSTIDVASIVSVFPVPVGGTIVTTLLNKDQYDIKDGLHPIEPAAASSH
ncbi:hypothetical protein [Neptuniibacter marinus]|uniref:hypothetical protein n=1 Tax=Neptuniibacter marinus TaxID=1806670 RepID=UPI003B5C1B9A